MHEPGDLPLATHTSTPDGRPPCSIISIIPSIGMSSCRGRAEAFARSLSSKLRTLGSQNADEGGANPEDEPIINGANTWVNPHESEQNVTDLQPLRHESDSFFDFDCELESPGSPVDECEYLRLIETASNTPHNSTAESGYACASVASSHSSTDGPYFDAATNGTSHDQLTVTTKQPQRIQLPADELKDYVNGLQMNGSHEPMTNGFDDHHHEPKLENEESAATHKTVDEVSLQAQILCELHQQSVSFEDIANGHSNQEESVEQLTNGHAEQALDEEHQEQQVEEELLQIQTIAVSVESAIEATEIVETSGESEKLPEGIDETDKSCNTTALHVDVDASIASENTEPVALKTNHHHHGMDTTDDEDDCRPQRVRRCSSLKTGKTPPGTPGRKKIVRFADVLGLDLADVKTFLDEIPNIPKSAFEDLEILELEPPLQLGPKSDKMLMPLFQQPGGLATFLDAVREKQVSLENAAVTDNINQTINGSVRVRNLDFHKSVHIRYSLDGWRSYADLQANYVENSCDGFSDKFTFVLFGNSLHVGQRLEFAVRFQCKGQQFWDNNYGANYCFQCLPTSNAITVSPVTLAGGPRTAHHASNMTALLSPTVGEAWCSSFY